MLAVFVEVCGGRVWKGRSVKVGPVRSWIQSACVGEAVFIYAAGCVSGEEFDCLGGMEQLFFGGGGSGVVVVEFGWAQRYGLTAGSRQCARHQ